MVSSVCGGVFYGQAEALSSMWRAVEVEFPDLERCLQMAQGPSLLPLVLSQ